uniref:Uncharacterized protein n=1 Tax=Romanomermis culicivorax TaxID=13658 RepID=A0A915IC61_ROMCU
WCCTHCSSIDNLIIEEGQVASWDGNSLISTLGDLGGCWVTSDHCVLQDGVVIWDEIPFQRVYTFGFENFYKIKLIDPRMIIDDLQVAFYIQNATSFSHKNCPGFDEHTFRTEQGIYRIQSRIS